MPPLKQFTVHSDFERPNTTQSANENNNGCLLTSTQNNKKSFLNEIYAQKLLLNLNALRQDCRFCDVEIIAGGRVFNAHRIILSASSAYFEAMFRPDLGLCEGKQKSVVLHSIDANILKALIEFIYTGQIIIEQHNVQVSLHKFYNQLQIFISMSICVECLTPTSHILIACKILLALIILFTFN